MIVKLSPSPKDMKSNFKDLINGTREKSCVSFYCVMAVGKKSDKQVGEAVEIVLKELDLQDCQALWVFQSDADNLYVHVTVNKISPETY